MSHDHRSAAPSRQLPDSSPGLGGVVLTPQGGELPEAHGAGEVKVRPWSCTQEDDPLSRVGVRPVVSTGSLGME